VNTATTATNTATAVAVGNGNSSAAISVVKTRKLRAVRPRHDDTVRPGAVTTNVTDAEAVVDAADRHRQRSIAAATDATDTANIADATTNAIAVAACSVGSVQIPVAQSVLCPALPRQFVQ
jgi:hypothetical protein